MLKIYGKKPTRVVRCLWALEELGLPYELVLTDFLAGETRTPEYLALNPMGKVPVLVDGDFVLAESVAINSYLAAKVAPTPLFPNDVKVQAQINQWSSWAITELEFHFTTMVREIRRAGGAGEDPDKAVVGACLAAFAELFVVLDAKLATSAYLAGEVFTIADINVAFLASGLSTRLDMAPYANVSDWLARCTARPAWHRVQAME